MKYDVPEIFGRFGAHILAQFEDDAAGVLPRDVDVEEDPGIVERCVAEFRGSKLGYNAFLFIHGNIVSTRGKFVNIKIYANQKCGRRREGRALVKNKKKRGEICHKLDSNSIYTPDLEYNGTLSFIHHPQTGTRRSIPDASRTTAHAAPTHSLYLSLSLFYFPTSPFFTKERTSTSIVISELGGTSPRCLAPKPSSGGTTTLLRPPTRMAGN